MPHTAATLIAAAVAAAETDQALAAVSQRPAVAGGNARPDVQRRQQQQPGSSSAHTYMPLPPLTNSPAPAHVAPAVWRVQPLPGTGVGESRGDGTLASRLHVNPGRGGGGQGSGRAHRLELVPAVDCVGKSHWLFGSHSKGGGVDFFVRNTGGWGWGIFCAGRWWGGLLCAAQMCVWCGGGPLLCSTQCVGWGAPLEPA